MKSEKTLLDTTSRGTESIACYPTGTESVACYPKATVSREEVPANLAAAIDKILAEPQDMERQTTDHTLHTDQDKFIRKIGPTNVER